MSGPGETRYEAQEDGSIVVIRWDDPAWTTRFIDAEDAKRPDVVARRLRDAYLAGFADRGEVVRRAIGAAS